MQCSPRQKMPSASPFARLLKRACYLKISIAPTGIGVNCTLAVHSIKRSFPAADNSNALIATNHRYIGAELPKVRTPQSNVGHSIVSILRSTLFAPFRVPQFTSWPEISDSCIVGTSGSCEARCALVTYCLCREPGVPCFFFKVTIAVERGRPLVRGHALRVEFGLRRLDALEMVIAVDAAH